MIRHICAAALAALAFAAPIPATPALAQEAVSLVGTWSGPRERIAKEGGRIEGTATLVITVQNGRTFTGHLSRDYASSGPVDEPLWGAFTPGGDLIAGADDEGHYSFRLVDANTLDFCYTETASPRATCGRLTRQK